MQRAKEKKPSLKRIMWVFLLLTLLSLAYFLFCRYQIEQLEAQVTWMGAESWISQMPALDREQINEAVQKSNEAQGKLYGRYGFYRRENRAAANAIFCGLGFAFTGAERLRRYLYQKFQEKMK